MCECVYRSTNWASLRDPFRGRPWWLRSWIKSSFQATVTSRAPFTVKSLHFAKFGPARREWTSVIGCAKIVILYWTEQASVLESPNLDSIRASSKGTLFNTTLLGITEQRQGAAFDSLAAGHSHESESTEDFLLVWLGMSTSAQNWSCDALYKHRLVIRLSLFPCPHFASTFSHLATKPTIETLEQR